MRQLVVLAALVFLAFLPSCEEEDPETTILVTEEVLYASGEQVRLLGRLITNQSIAVADHGFYLATNETFSDQIIISLGAKTGPGRFIGESRELKAQQRYFVKAFMDLGSGVEFGNVLELETLAAGLESYSPGFGKPGDEVVILGRNFTQDTRVFFGDQEAQVLENQFESRIRVRVPEAQGASSVTLRVQSQEQNLSFNIPFEYQTGAYVKLADFPDVVRLIDNIHYSRSGMFYLGLGSNRGVSFYEKIQAFDPASGQWSPIDFPGSSRSHGFATSNYLGGGIAEITREPFVFDRSFWRNTPAGFVRLDDLPFDSWESIAVELQNVLYVIGGNEGDGFVIRRYDPMAGTWDFLGNAPAQLSTRNPHFVYQDQLYVITDEGDLIRYNPADRLWQTVSFFPGSQGLGYGFAEVIGSKVYVGGFRRSAEIWELNLENFNWVSKNPIPGSAQGITAGSFTQGGFVYLMRQQDINLAGSFPLELYRLDPNGI